MLKLLKYIPVLLGIARTVQRDPRVRRAYQQAQKRRGTSRRR